MHLLKFESRVACRFIKKSYASTTSICTCL